MPESIPQEEKPILLKLLNLRMRLSVMKRDRTTHLDINQIEPIRQETAQLIEELINVRHGVLLKDHQKPNRCDDLLDEVCQMISLCFLSLGKTRESPAVYSQVVSISHCFERLDEFGIYAEEFLEPYANMLKDIKNVLEIDERNETLSKPVMQILWNKFHQCDTIYKRLLNTIHEVSPELLPIRNQLLRIRRQLLIIACQSNFHSKDILPLQEELQEIDEQRVDGKFLAADGSIPAGQAVVTGLLDQVHRFAYDLVIVTTSDFSPALQSLRERLVEIKNHLERLALTQKWTMRQTDLFTYQHQLHDIVKLRYHGEDDDKTTDQDKMGKFLDAEGNAPDGQTVVNFLLHKCYRMILELLNESVPVGEALTPIYNQLTSVKKCLIAVKKTGAPCTPEELYPYQMKLASIEDLRKDGKFYDDRGDLPEGQALCVNTLEECYQLLDDLRQMDDN
ncbi:uncharacterized protein BX664DRAFT_381663 [Halteromyces radiatus]|uniref:uncharacterized protein n=1 Tax=Halteromyces radiatus TaxID=101107 RepID=UPI00221EE2B8|nr:uncharacterized protein BX664DRAFT_381663 [Halteromyces radiatus]KAI8099042.1 hypothetical protein BX664DRAFT_381663 [Halteromyces radiatus]